MKDLQKKHYVYFLRSTCSEGRIKIGCSYKPASRLTALGAWSPYELELIAVAPGGFDTERALHAYFAADRLHREWFRSSPELLFVIDQMSKGKPLSEAVWEYSRSLSRAA
jgi:hypothetical protein